MTRSIWAALGVSLFLLAASIRPASPAWGAEALTLRLEDIDARAGETMVLVVRTYTPKPVGSGQMCIRLRRRARRAAPSPLEHVAGPTRRGTSSVIESIDSVVVFTPEGDAAVSSELLVGSEGEEIVLEFTSASAGINAEDGPMLAIVAQLAAGAVAGDEVEIEVDAAQTFLVDDQDQAIPLRLRAGELTVLGITEPTEVALELESLTADFALLTVETQESLLLADGSLEIDIPGEMLSGPPQASIPTQQGMASVSMSRKGGDTYSIDFSVLPDSPLRFGELPGDLLLIELPLADGPRSSAELHFDPANSSLFAIGEGKLNLDLEQGVSLTTGGGLLFSNGFESRADPSEWSKSVER